MNEYVLYGSPGSFFSGKARAYLRAKRLPFDDRMASIASYVRTIFPKTRRHYIPVVITPEGDTLQDTSVIIDTLEARLGPSEILPTGPRQRLVGAVFEAFCDEWMVLPAMHYRWNFDADNAEFNRREFGEHLVPGWPSLAQDLLADAVMTPWRRALLALGIDDATGPEIERRSHWIFATLDRHFGAHDYVLGGRPSLADISLMGPFTHLCRDPHPQALLERAYPHVPAWFRRMSTPPAQYGAFLEGDAVPSEILSMLTFIFDEPFSMLAGASEVFERWHARRLRRRIPRFVGVQQLRVGGAAAPRAAAPYAQWMLQRAQDAFDVARSAELEAWLEGLGGLAPLTRRPAVPVRLGPHNRVVVG